MKQVYVIYDGFKCGRIGVIQPCGYNHYIPFNPNDCVIITKQHFDSLVSDSDWLDGLEAEGGGQLAWDILCLRTKGGDGG